MRCRAAGAADAADGAGGLKVAQRLAVRPEEIRRHNLSLLLRHIHQHGELTRAELTAATGLNRSTIGALVSDLVGLGLVIEYVPSVRDRAGRPSYVVAPRADGPYVIAVDVAVKRIVTASVGLGGVIHERRELAIEGVARRPALVAARIVEDVRWLARHRPDCGPVGIGVSIPGTVGRSDGRVEHAPNLGWRSVSFGRLVADLLPFELEVRLGNDADLGAVAEHQRGAAIGYDHMVYLNGSVGVGAGVITEGAQLYGAGGYAGEIGHMTINPDGPACHCGSTGCIETYIGEQALLRAAGVLEPLGPHAVDAVFSDAAAGDPRARAAVHSVSVWLGRTLANLVNCFNPQVIVVGGSLAELVRLERDTVETELDRRAMGALRAGVKLLLAGLGRDSALIGAAELAFQDLLSAPDSPIASIAT